MKSLHIFAPVKHMSMENVISKCNICNQNFTARRYNLRGPGVLFLFLVHDPHF